MRGSRVIICFPREICIAATHNGSAVAITREKPSLAPSLPVFAAVTIAAASLAPYLPAP
jgi:hypothetical protein